MTSDFSWMLRVALTSHFAVDGVMLIIILGWHPDLWDVPSGVAQCVPLEPKLAFH